MVNRTRFLLDLDSEGFPKEQPYGIEAFMIGKRHDDPTAGAMLADARCLNCEPRCAQPCAPTPACICDNPFGWRDVAVNLQGEPERTVKLPPITWAEQQEASSIADAVEHVLAAGRAM